MKLLDALLLYPAFALIIIGLHQVMVNGFANSYWILMLALILLYVYQWRKTKQKEKETVNEKPQEIKKRKKQ